MIILILIFIINNHNIYELLTIRLSKGISGIFSERNQDWHIVFEQDNIFKLIFGNGLGTGGHRSITYKSIDLYDGNFIKMIYEIGFFGLIIFLIILIYAINCGIKKYFKYHDSNLLLYLSIVLGVIIMAIGSSVFTFQDIMPIFWFSIGVLVSKNYNNTATVNN